MGIAAVWGLTFVMVQDAVGAAAGAGVPRLPLRRGGARWWRSSSARRMSLRLSPRGLAGGARDGRLPHRRLRRPDLRARAHDRVERRLHHGPVRGAHAGAGSDASCATRLARCLRGSAAGVSAARALPAFRHERPPLAGDCAGAGLRGLLRGAHPRPQRTASAGHHLGRAAGGPARGVRRGVPGRRAPVLGEAGGAAGWDGVVGAGGHSRGGERARLTSSRASRSSTRPRRGRP